MRDCSMNLGGYYYYSWRNTSVLSKRYGELGTGMKGSESQTLEAGIRTEATCRQRLLLYHS